ncbi:hypothetical protein [Bradyrhizobium hereditatis]|uniref:hypothetical protein n=1 Tax=Bradyrhizobium hereditatis TaxID=2821405 RepID=UPI001CE23421|nr:hypothetical protein [Bradyrhizobium hereditatis]
MTYLALIPQNWLLVLREELAQMLEITRQNRSGSSRGIVHGVGSIHRHEGERTA